MSKFDAQFAGRLDGQTVMVTGTKGGIGHETAKALGTVGRLCWCTPAVPTTPNALSTYWSPTATATASTCP